METATPTIDYSTLSISELAALIRKNWKNVNFAAEPYLSAMFSLQTVNDRYMVEDGVSIVLRFLCNASSWRGPVAKLIKAELNKRVKGR